jgi:hypothetical protein
MFLPLRESDHGPLRPVAGAVPVRANLFMRLYDTVPRETISDCNNEEARVESLCQTLDNESYPFQRFPSLEPRHRRNSAKRMKRDKSGHLHELTTAAVLMSDSFAKLPRWRNQYISDRGKSNRRRTVSELDDDDVHDSDDNTGAAFDPVPATDGGGCGDGEIDGAGQVVEWSACNVPATVSLTSESECVSGSELSSDSEVSHNAEDGDNNARGDLTE